MDFGGSRIFYFLSPPSVLMWEPLGHKMASVFKWQRPSRPWVELCAPLSYPRHRISLSDRGPIQLLTSLFRAGITPVYSGSRVYFFNGTRSKYSEAPLQLYDTRFMTASTNDIYEILIKWKRYTIMHWRIRNAHTHTHVVRTSSRRIRERIRQALRRS